MFDSVCAENGDSSSENPMFGTVGNECTVDQHIQRGIYRMNLALLIIMAVSGAKRRGTLLFWIAAREHQRREEKREEGDRIRCTVLSTPRATVLTDLDRM